MKLVAKMAPALIFMLAVSTVTNAFSKENPVLLIKTSEGDIKVELFADKAPLSAKNFLAYAEAGDQAAALQVYNALYETLG